MQPTEGVSITRRPLDVEDYIDIMRRHKSWIFGPFLLCVVASVVGVFLWPDSYISVATIRIVPQQVPDALVMSSFNSKIWDRIISMQQTIESTGELTNIINTKNLYRREIAHMTMQDVVEKMRGDIHVLQVGASLSNEQVIPAFQITYAYEDRVKAQQVVSELMTKFIDQSSKNSSEQTYAAVELFKDEVATAKKALDEAETRLTEFQVQNNGRLPDQQEANDRSLMTLETQLSTEEAQLGRATTDRLQLVSQIGSTQDSMKEITRIAKESPQLTAGAAQRNERLVEAENNVQKLQDRLRELRQLYNDSYPDVQTNIGLLNSAQTKLDELRKEDADKQAQAKKDAETAKASKKDPPNPGLEMNLLNQNQRITALQASLQALDMQIEQYKKNITRLTGEMKMIQGRLDSAPAGSKVYSDLLRDKELAKTKYEDLARRLDTAERSQFLTARNEGERLEQLDPASLPTDPTEPKRPMVIGIGAAFGLLLGVAIAGAREMKDTSLKNLKDVRAYTQMSVLGSIPLLENDFVVRRRRRLAWLGWTTACLVAVVVMVGAIVYYASTRGGVQ
ncbi:MAG TPA: hypothetical protein VKS01_03025 [Bryobacteraceae bacterium]|nr:hypothetical protein [Bryobacteraceae bacterium]